MGKIREPPPVKLIVSMFTADETLLAVARGALANRFGPMDYQSELLSFYHTDYYAREFGPGLMRQIVAFADLIPAEHLAEVKRTTNGLELTWAMDGKRQVNLDPGYVSLGKLVLATTKDYSHRIYLGQGIYAEVTLKYEHGTFQPWKWTYPDYASARYLEIFSKIRQMYAEQLHGTRAT
jgi:hypothetical protein